MVHTLRSLRLPRPRLVLDPGLPARVIDAHREAFWRAWQENPRRVLWLALWAPFWIGSDAPRPAMPGSGPIDLGEAPPTAAGSWLTTRIDGITRQFRIAWMAGSVLRGITLALLVLAAWSLSAILGAFALPGWSMVTIVLIAGMLIGALHGWLVHPHRLLVAHMLDHTFSLNERIITAFDRDADTSYVSRIQLADAANTLEEILVDVPRTTFLPVREAALFLVATGALVTALLANVPQRPVDPTGPSPVAAFVPASERLAVRDNPLPQQSVENEPSADQESLAEMQEQARAAQSAREDLTTIGEALEEHPITQPAADSIASGDYAAAADSLRAAAESASGMPQEQRDALADDLEAAADQIAESNPELAQAAREAADALREGGPAAESALNELADEIDNTGDQAQAPGGGSPNLDESQPGGSDGTSEGQGDQGSEGGAGEGSQSSEQQSGEGAGSDPGEGADAAPGVSNGEQEPAPGSANEGEQGSANDGSGSSGENGGQQPQDGGGSGGQGEDGASANSADGGSAGEEQGTTGAPDEETDSSQGSGAGTGQSGANDQSSSEGEAESAGEPEGADPNAEVPQDGEAGDPPASREARGEEDDGSGSTSPGSSTIELEGTSDENIPSGGTSGSASLGSGSGSSTSSGDQDQGEIGLAGPDSNRVPDSLRDVVQDFFDGQQP